jgi:hypothetical protein
VTMALLLLSLAVLLLLRTEAAFAQSVHVSVDGLQSKATPLTGFGNEMIFQSVNDTGLNNAIFRAGRCVCVLVYVCG